MRTRIEIRVDRYTRLCLTAIAVLLTVVVVGLWAQTPLAAPAVAGDPGPGRDGFGDAGPRVTAQLEAVQKTNAKLDEVIRLLTSGEIKVQLVKEKEEKASGGANVTPPKTR